MQIKNQYICDRFNKNCIKPYNSQSVDKKHISVVFYLSFSTALSRFLSKCRVAILLVVHFTVHSVSKPVWLPLMTD